MPIIGIDLGTTNSLAACFIDGKSVIIQNSLGQNLTPSVVSMLENGSIIVGSAAKERLITSPELTASAFKRFMGTARRYQFGKYYFSPTELSSFVLKSLKADAEAFLGSAIDEAIISVPAYFNDEQRRATKQAGELAGLKVERLINEPSAAALAYGLNQASEELKFMIFDLGGGTFDVSIMNLFENLMEVRAVAGNNYLGGEDFTGALADHFLQKFGLLRETIEPKALSALLKRAESCKIALSEEPQAVMSCRIDGREYTLEVTAGEFEELLEKYIKKLRLPVQQALRDSSLSPYELDKVILVGGSTRMPVVRTFVGRFFGRVPICSLNPDEVVAIGASMKERNETLRETVLTDVCPFTLGVEVSMEDGFGGHTPGRYLPIIERNTTIPDSKVERLCPVNDNQDKITVNIYQGESLLVANNVKLGEITAHIPKGPKEKGAIDVRYTYDINGILEVIVTIVATGESKREVIVNSGNTLSGKEIENGLKNLRRSRYTRATTRATNICWPGPNACMRRRSPT